MQRRNVALGLDIYGDAFSVITKAEPDFIDKKEQLVEQKIYDKSLRSTRQFWTDAGLQSPSAAIVMLSESLREKIFTAWNEYMRLQLDDKTEGVSMKNYMEKKILIEDLCWREKCALHKKSHHPHHRAHHAHHKRACAAPPVVVDCKPKVVNCDPPPMRPKCATVVIVEKKKLPEPVVVVNEVVECKPKPVECKPKPVVCEPPPQKDCLKEIMSGTAPRRGGRGEFYYYFL
jgi:hypothetical protein